MIDIGRAHVHEMLDIGRAHEHNFVGISPFVTCAGAGCTSDAAQRSHQQILVDLGSLTTRTADW